jgi:hypothetical protein
VHISTAHYRQNFDVVGTHALESQIKPLVRVDVWKNKPIHEIIQVLGITFGVLSFERQETDNANYTSSIRHQTRS